MSINNGENCLLNSIIFVHHLNEIARMNSIEKHFVDFKLNILAEKGYQLPFLPELHNDFLKDSMKNCIEGEVTMD